jgi:MFS family permease
VATARNETEAERADRNWNELLQELRVTQTGVQILAGFLLTLPFQQRFSELSTPYRAVFLTAFLLATVATGLLIAPVSAHRVLFRKHEKDVLVETSDLLAKAGLCALSLTMVTVVLLIFGVVLGTTAGLVASGLVLLFFVVFWVAVPLALLAGHRARPREVPSREVPSQEVPSQQEGLVRHASPTARSVRQGQ